MGQSWDGRTNMRLNNTVEKGRKSASKKKSGTAKTRRTKKPNAKNPSFFQSFTEQFNQVAPLDWLPSSYQVQIKTARPVRLSPVRKRKPTTSLH